MIGFSTYVSDYAVIYRWWSHAVDKRVWKHIDVPIILSIATLRVHNPQLSIYVIDYSGGGYDWGDYPSRLNFSLIPFQSTLETSIAKKDLWTLPNTNPYTGRGPLESASDKVEHNLDALDVRASSWPIDMSEICHLLPEQVVISSDCDVFWLKPLLPISGDSKRFNTRMSTTGIFYFDKSAEKSRRWLELWQAYISLASRDFNFRRRLVEAYPSPAIIDANKSFFYIRDTYPSIFEEYVYQIESHDCLLPSDHFGDGFEKEFVEKVKCVHVYGQSMGRWKGKFPLLFADVFDSIRPYFSIAELLDIFQMDSFNNSIFRLENLCDPSYSDFYDHLIERMYAEIRPL